MKRLGWVVCVLALAFLLAPALAQGNRGKAELKAGSGNIVLDYGRPSLKGRDMLSQLKEGSFWRMGMNQAATLTTPVDLTFGGTKIAKGSYSIWLLKSAGDKFELVFNSQTGQWGTQHDVSKDLSKVALTKSSTPSPVEVFTIELKEAPKGGTFVMTWGATSLTAGFEAGS